MQKFASSVDGYSLLASVDPVTDGGAAARFRAGRALAYEGLYAWPLALRDYDETLRLAEVGGFLPDPYVLNSRGNCRGSLGDWGGAREDYLESARLFQSSKGFRSGASTTQRLDGAVYRLQLRLWRSRARRRRAGRRWRRRRSQAGPQLGGHAPRSLRSVTDGRRGGGGRGSLRVGGRRVRKTETSTTSGARRWPPAWSKSRRVPRR